MIYKFSKNSRIIVNKDKVVLANRETGKWTRISKQVYDILNDGIVNKLSINELKDNLYDDEDRNYMDVVFENLFDLGIINYNNNSKNENFKNKIASFELTHRCNLKCIHCCIDADGIVSDKRDLTTKQVKEVLDKLIQWNPERIMLSGGEPMVRKDFFEILGYLKENYSGDIVLSTNGILINEANVNLLSKNLDQIDISLDGVDEQTCSIVRGPGVFNKVLNSIKLLKNTGFEKITVSMVVGNKNQYLENRFNELNKKLGTKPIIRQFDPIGRGFYSKSIFTELGKDAQDKDLKNNNDRMERICNCSAGVRELFIGYNGDIYPCPSFIQPKYFLGNLVEISNLNNLPSIKNKCVSEYDLLNILNLEIYKECRECKVNLFCWKCPSILDEMKNRKLDIEHRCKKMKPILYNSVWEEKI